MTNNPALHIVKDLPNKRITVTRKFQAPLEHVWRAWTEQELLDQWWAPNPLKTVTKVLDFKEGGYWLYSMIGPDNTALWARVDFTKIDLYKSFESVDSFCDEQGTVDIQMPGMKWKIGFLAIQNDTEVRVEISFTSEADLEKIVAMGFEIGFTAALGNLEHFLNTQFKIRKELKPDNTARVTTYLNFPGKTEEAFYFYKKIFNGVFTGNGLKRFGDIEMPAGMPPMSDADKKLVIHAELTIMAGHVLMATDSPESMGLRLQYGNNMHINLEPESRKETERLFKALSEKGNIIMPLADMFWDAYFASFTDRYGVNWMLNYQTKNLI